MTHVMYELECLRGVVYGMAGFRTRLSATIIILKKIINNNKSDDNLSKKKKKKNIRFFFYCVQCVYLLCAVPTMSEREHVNARAALAKCHLVISLF